MRISTHVAILTMSQSAIRFAVGDESGYSSPSWRVWTKADGDSYIRCRDGFQELKVSLHGDRWRIGMTVEGAAATAHMRPEGEDRAWMKWNRPEQIGGITMGFRILFLPSELSLLPTDRPARRWREVEWVPAAPLGSVTVATVTLNSGVQEMIVEGVGQYHGFLPLAGGGRLQLTLHQEVLGEGFRAGISNAFRYARAFAEAIGVTVPTTGRTFLVGRGGSDNSPFATEVAFHRPSEDALRL
jgi:hypothetical protein